MQKPVAPLAGAWIEIKLNPIALATGAIVAPLAGAWIEMIQTAYKKAFSNGRSPRGSVD